MRYACLRIGRRLGVEVEPVLTRREIAEPATRAQALIASLVAAGKLEGALRIPNTVGPIVLTADVRASRVAVSVDLDAPREGRAVTRINWLTRQLKGAPDTLRIDCYAAHSRGSSTSELLKDVRQNPGLLIQDPKREPRAFHLALTAPMGTKRGSGRGSFVTSVLDLLDVFYESTVQTVKPWSAAPPKLRPEPEDVEIRVPVEMVSTSLSSQDGTQPKTSEAHTPDAREPTYLYIPFESNKD